MKNTPKTLFISYARHDGRQAAAQLQSALEGNGFKTWRDERDLDYHQDFGVGIEQAILESDEVVVCLTPSIIQRDDSFVRREIIYAQNQDKPITPLIFVGFPPKRIPINIVHLSYLDFSHFDAGMTQLLTLLNTERAAVSPATNDPFHAYLKTLYDEVVEILRVSVFSTSEVQLRSKATQDAVEPILPPIPTPRLMAEFAPTLRHRESPAPTPPSTEFENFAAAFQHYKGRVLLLGEPGAGKTITLLAFLRDAIIQRQADATSPLPLLARITSWDANQQTPIMDWLGERMGNLYDSALQKLTQNAIESGQALLLLDGLDELGNRRKNPDASEGDFNGAYDPRLRFVEAVHVLPAENQLLLTCRVKDYAEIGEKLKLNGAVTLQPLTDAQIAEYLAEQTHLLAAIESDEGLREMARTPLLLSILAYAYEDMGEQAAELRNLVDSPNELRDKIFAAYIRHRFEHEQGKQNAKLPFSLARTIQVLAQVALEDTLDMQYENEFGTWILEEVLQSETMTFIDHARQLNLILPTEEGRFRFVHLYLRNFLAFEALIETLRIIEDGKRVQDILNWRDEQMTGPDGAIILDREGDDLDRVEEAVEALGNLKEQRAFDLLIKALDCLELNIASSAMRALVQLGDLRAVEALIPYLNDRDGWIRWHSAINLGAFGDVRAVEPLIHALANSERFLKERDPAEPDPYREKYGREQLIQKAAVGSLQTIGTPEALAAVKEWERRQQSDNPPT